MKHKRWLAAVAAVVSVVLATVAFAACGEKDAPRATLVKSEEKLVVITADKTDAEKSLADALAYFAEQGTLTYEATGSGDSFYLTSINGYTPDSAAHEFWAIYTTLGEYENVSYSNAEYGTYEYNGLILNSASFGAAGLPLVEGQTYLFALSTY